MPQNDNKSHVSNEQLAEILLHKGYLSQEQLEFALKDTRRSGMSHLGQYLIRNKWLDMAIVANEMNLLKENTHHKKHTQNDNPQGYKSTIYKTNQKTSQNIQLPGPGQKFDNYTIIREIARGGMGVVYLAQDASKRNFALKILFSTSTKKNDQVRFVREGKAISMLDHPNIVRVYAMKEESGYRFFTMDYIEGGTFEDTIQSDTNLRELIRILIRISKALASAHDKKIVHRDIKPSNILMNEENKPFITDFGLAKIGGDKTMTKSGATLGTPQYMAPEQALGEIRNIDHRTDLYALGVMLYKCLTKKLPFQSDTLISLYKKIALDAPVAPSKINEKIPSNLEKICLKAIAKDKKDRYQSGNQFARDLESFLKNRKTKIKYRSNNWKIWLRKNSIRLYFVFGLIVLGVTVGSVFLPSSKQENHPKYQQIQNLYQKSLFYAEDGDWDRAIVGYKTILKINEYFTPAYIEYAKALAQLKEFSKAHKILENASIKIPDKTRDIQMQKARIFISQKSAQKALKIMNKVMIKHSSFVPALRLRASIYKLLGKNRLADSDNKKANEKEASTNIETKAVRKYLVRNNYSSALLELEKLQSTHGNITQILYLRSEIFYLQKLWTAALAEISQAITKDPSVTNYLQKAKISFAAGYIENAQQVLNNIELVGVDPKNEIPYYTLKGRIALQIKDYANAYSSYSEVLKQADTVENYMYCGEAAYYLQKYDISLQYLHKALQKNSILEVINARCYMLRGIVYRAIGKYKAALSEFEKALSKNQYLHLATVYLGATHIDLKKYKEGFSYLTQVQKHISDKSLLYEYLAKYYIYNNQISAALEKLNICLKMTPWEARYYYLYGKALVKSKKYKEAEQYFIRSLELNPGDMTAFTPLLINLMDQGSLEKTILVPGYYNSYTAHFWTHGEPDDLFRDQYHALNLQYQVLARRQKNTNYQNFIKILENDQQKKLRPIAINALSYFFEDEKLQLLLQKKLQDSKDTVWIDLKEKLERQRYKAEKNYIKRLIVRLLIGRDKTTFSLFDQKGITGEKFLQEILLSDRENMLMRFLACRTLLALGTPSGYTIVQEYVKKYKNTDISVLATVALKEKTFTVNRNILLQGLQNENPLLRSLCVQNIYSTKGLKPLLKDRDERVRVYAAKQLLVSVENTKLRDRCYDILSNATKSENPFVKIFGCMALWPKKIHRELAATPSKAFLKKYQHTLVACVQDNHPMVKKVAATRIGAYFMKNLAPYLEKLAKENDSAARYQALISLGWMAKGKDLIRKISANPKESLLMRSTIIPVLHSQQNMDLPFELDDLIKEEKPDAARFVMSFVGIVAGKFGPFLLQQYLDYPDEDIQASATCGVIFHGTSSLTEKLKEQTQSKFPKVRRLSYATLIGIMSREQKNELAKFHKLLVRKPQEIRESAAFGYYFPIYYKTLESTVSQYIDPKVLQSYDPYFFDNVFKFLYEKFYLTQFKTAIRNEKTRKDYLWRLTKAIEVYPTQRYYSERSFIYKEEKKWDKAVADMLKVISMNPKEERYYHMLFDFCSQAKEYDTILKVSDKLNKLNPRILEGWNYKAKIFFERKQYDKALEAYGRSYVLSPTSWIYYIQMGICQFQLGNYERSLETFLYISNRVYPQSKDQIFNVILSYSKLGKYSKAIAFLKKKKSVRITYKELSKYKDLRPILSDPWIQRLK